MKILLGMKAEIRRLVNSRSNFSNKESWVDYVTAELESLKQFNVISEYKIWPHGYLIGIDMAVVDDPIETVSFRRYQL